MFPSKQSGVDVCCIPAQSSGTIGYATAHFWPQLIWIDLVIKDGNGKSPIKLSMLCRWFSHDIFGFVSSRLEPTRFTGQWIGFRGNRSTGKHACDPRSSGLWISPSTNSPEKRGRWTIKQFMTKMVSLNCRAWSSQGQWSSATIFSLPPGVINFLGHCNLQWL